MMTVNRGEDDSALGADVDLRLAFPPGAEPPFRTPVSALVATAVRRGRRRRIATLSAKAALFAVPVISAVFVLANLLPRPVTTAVSPPSTSTGAPSRPAAACTGSQLSGRVFRGGSEASQPFDEIVLTNGGPGSCRLSGYPALTAWGSAGQGPSSQLDTVLTKSSTYEIPDPGPTTVVIAPSRSAWFAIGTATAYDPPLVSIDRVLIDVGSGTSGKSGQVSVALGMFATAPLGKPIPITVTAFAPGLPPKQ
jgi:hypothetical protein